MGDKTLRSLTVGDVRSHSQTATSDVAFELKVANYFEKRDFECQHGGTYWDPVSGKSRQFDIRACKNYSTVDLKLAVECKNIKNFAPLIAHCVPRRINEAFNEVIQGHFGFDGRGEDVRLAPQIKIVRYEGNSIYGQASDNKEHYVCKLLTQVWEEKVPKGTILVEKDGEVFDKWTQAVSSSFEIIQKTGRHYSTIAKVGSRDKAFILPILVVPDEILWRIKYDQLGNVQGEPSIANRVSVYLGTQISPWSASAEDLAYNYKSYTISHLEVTTYSGLDELIETLVESFRVERPPRFS